MFERKPRGQPLDPAEFPRGHLCVQHHGEVLGRGSEVKGLDSAYRSALSHSGGRPFYQQVSLGDSDRHRAGDWAYKVTKGSPDAGGSPSVGEAHLRCTEPGLES